MFYEDYNFRNMEEYSRYLKDLKSFCTLNITCLLIDFKLMIK